MDPIDDPDESVQKRCRRYNDPGHAHFLTFSFFRRQPFLSRDRARQWVIDGIRLAQATHAFDVWAYVLMPEHVHLIVFPRERAYNVSAILSTIKQSTSKRAIRFVRQTVPEFLQRMADVQPNGKTTIRFWQRGGGYDCNLWSPKPIWDAIDYVHNNPVKRGLCQSPEHWTWSSAADHLGVREVPVAIGREFLPLRP